MRLQVASFNLGRQGPNSYLLERHHSNKQLDNSTLADLGAINKALQESDFSKLTSQDVTTLHGNVDLYKLESEFSEEDGAQTEIIDDILYPVTQQVL